jgi:hypothetical protein
MNGTVVPVCVVVWAIVLTGGGFAGSYGCSWTPALGRYSS